MQYVSAQWVTNPTGGPNSIKAIGDDDVEYIVPSWNCDIPPWPEYIINGGSIAPAEEPANADGPADEPE